MATVGLLYPGHSAEDDFTHAERIPRAAVPDLTARFPVTITSVGRDAHEVDALLDLGSMQRLTEGPIPREAAQALLVPDTAMHTLALIPDLEDTAGMPVLTANQGTVWEGLRLAGEIPCAPGLGVGVGVGALFAADRFDPVLPGPALLCSR